MEIDFSLPVEDLEFIFSALKNNWEKLRNRKLLITGGTGFFGIWLLESFLYANSKLNLNAEAIIITRNIENVSKRFPHLIKASELKFLKGDVKEFDHPDTKVDFIIHAASGGSLILNDSINGSVVSTSIDGTRNVLEYARKCPGVTLLYTSSGAAYGKQPEIITHVSEEYAGAPDTMNKNSSYGESKRFCEMLCALYGEQYTFDVKIARCFAFVGPYLPLQSNYAIGNFIFDALHGANINILGDGTPRRSYLYSSELTVWLWTILFKGKNKFLYNVGSDVDLSIFDLATKVKELINPSCEILVKHEYVSKGIERYVPSIERIRSDLGLSPKITLEDAIIKTTQWYNSKFKI